MCVCVCGGWLGRQACIYNLSNLCQRPPLLSIHLPLKVNISCQLFILIANWHVLNSHVLYEVSRSILSIHITAEIKGLHEEVLVP